MATLKSWGMKFRAAVCLSAFAVIVCFPANGDATPEVSLTVADSYMETDGGTIQVGLNYHPGNPIVVKLTVTPPNRTNSGELVLDSTYKTVPTGYSALSNNEYYVSLKYGGTASVGIASMDGTVASSMYGFTVKAEVVTPEWSDVYVPAEYRVYVENVSPIIGIVTSENANAWMVSGGVASSFPIRWQVRSDVDADLEAGITVRFEGCENAFTTNVTESTSGSFVPDFGSMLGSQMVRMTIEDKDGGAQTWTYLYEVLPRRYSATVDGVAWVYELCDVEKARIVGTDTVLTGNVTIPSELDGNAVVALAETALKNAHGVTGVAIPKSVVQIEDGAFAGLEEVLAQWYKSLAELVEGGASYGLGEDVADKTVASITVSDDATLGDFVLAKDKAYDSVVHIANTADREIRIILPEGYSYRVLKGSRPLTVPAHSECVLTITRLSARIFLVTVAELEALQ